MFFLASFENKHSHRRYVIADLYSLHPIHLHNTYLSARHRKHEIRTQHVRRRNDMCYRCLHSLVGRINPDTRPIIIITGHPLY